MTIILDDMNIELFGSDDDVENVISQIDDIFSDTTIEMIRERSRPVVFYCENDHIWGDILETEEDLAGLEEYLKEDGFIVEWLKEVPTLKKHIKE